MATARQIISMLNSHLQGDEEQFLAIAMQVAASEARRGRTQVAEDLRSLVDKVRSLNVEGVREGPSPRAEVSIPIVRPRGELQGLLSATYPKNRISDLIAPERLTGRIERLIFQQRSRALLREYGQTPQTRLLLVGPPGSGKTLTASVVAGELHLPLFVVRLEALITRYMGETSAKLRLIFDQISTVRGVYLFDEFDAIGGRRSAENDVGEMRRVLNTFLQFLEERNVTDSVVLATTNHPELLDRALFRRFDDVLDYDLPDDKAIEDLLRTELGGFSPRAGDWASILAAARGLSHAELVRAAGEAIKDAILSGNQAVRFDLLQEILADRHRAREAFGGVVGA